MLKIPSLPLLILPDYHARPNAIVSVKLNNQTIALLSQPAQAQIPASIGMLREKMLLLMLILAITKVVQPLQILEI